MKISVIVCTRNRAHAVLSSLDSIVTGLLKAMPVEAEIVVIDNDSDDTTNVVVRDWAKTCPFPVNVQLEKKRGLCYARNCGLRTAKGELIAFTDDDCRWSETYVLEWLAHVAKDTAPVLRGGRVELGDPTDLPITTKTSREPARWSKELNSARKGPLGQSIIGCNMTMTRALIDKAGFFDERFTRGGLSAADDIDLVFRSYVAGIAIEYVPDMVVYHYHGRKTPEQAYRLMRSYMLGSGALYAKFAFKDINLIRPVVWDLRLAYREFRSGGNDLLPEYNFSYRTMVRYWAQGAWLFYTRAFRH